MSRESQPGRDTTKFIQLESTPVFEREGFTGRILYDAPDGTARHLLIEVFGHHPEKRMTGDTTRSYHVMSGYGTFILNGRSEQVFQGDTVVINPDGSYQYSGEMVLYETNVSPSGTITDEKL